MMHALPTRILKVLFILQFEELVDFDSPIIVSCYHGVSSKNVATFLVEQGYENVFSIVGGFDGWCRAELPIETAY